MSIAFNPYITTVASGSFDGASSTGLVQGTALPDPAVRYALVGGVLASSETLPMWGGVGIYIDIPGAAGASIPLGTPVGRATALTGSKALLGFSVFDQNYAAVSSPQSPVPLVGVGGPVNYYPLGSRARLELACDPALVSLEGSIINTSVSWDFINQQVTPYMGSTAISSGTYNSTSGLVTLTVVGNTINPGDTVVISSATGTGSFASINGTYTAGAGTTATTITYTIAPSLTLTITGANFATSGILPVQLLSIYPTNCMTVSYNSVTGFATWNRNGAACVVRI